jgi:ethanolamine ammonia-lyase small subunit
MAIDLRVFTPARVALGRAGHSLPTAELLRFQLDHARARDAVYEALDPASLGIPHVLARSAAPDRTTYLRRPDLGRRLADGTALERGDYDAALVIADGLSAPAVHRHAAPLLDALLPRLGHEKPARRDGFRTETKVLRGQKPERRAGFAQWRLAPLTVVLQGRVAVGDEIGMRLGARLTVMLIGERPGLTSPDSLGVYLTWDPRPGRTDAERNCLSNIRTEGLVYEAAAVTLEFLMNAARSRRLSGVALKDEDRYLEH